MPPFNVISKRSIPEIVLSRIFFKILQVRWHSVLLGEQSEPHTGVFNRYVGTYVCLSCPKMRRRNYVAQTHACSKSVLGGRIRPVTPVLFISTIR